MSSVIARAHLDPNGEDLTVEHWQDCGDILERNKALRSEPQRSDWGRHVASVPNVILVQWLNEEFQRGNVGIRLFSKEFDEIIAKKLKDPDWKWLRVDK